MRSYAKRHSFSAPECASVLYQSFHSRKTPTTRWRNASTPLLMMERGAWFNENVCLLRLTFAIDEAEGATGVFEDFLVAEEAFQFYLCV